MDNVRGLLMLRPLQPLGVRRDGTMIWPIAGGSDTSTVADQPQQVPGAVATDPQSGFPNAQPQQPNGGQSGTLPPGIAPAYRDAQTGRLLSEAEVVARIEAAREEERSKLYARIKPVEEYETRIETLERELRERREAEEAAKRDEEQAAQAEAARRQEQEREEMDAKTLVHTVNQEWQQKFDQVQEELRRRDALLEKERQLAQLEAYRSQRLSEEAESIAPQLLTFVRGNTQEEIDQSIELAKQSTQQILEEVSQANTAFRQQAPGTRATLPPQGPMEMQSGQRSYTPEEIQAMPMDEFARLRPQLHAAARQGGLYG